MSVDLKKFETVEELEAAFDNGDLGKQTRALGKQVDQRAYEIRRKNRERNALIVFDNGEEGSARRQVVAQWNEVMSFFEVNEWNVCNQAGGGQYKNERAAKVRMATLLLLSKMVLSEEFEKLFDRLDGELNSEDREWNGRKFTNYYYGQCNVGRDCPPLSTLFDEVKDAAIQLAERVTS